MTTPTGVAPQRTSDEVFRDAERDDAYFRAQLNKDYTPSGRSAAEIGQALHDKYAPNTSSALSLLGFSPAQQEAIAGWQAGQETELLDMVLTPEQKANYLKLHAENAAKRALDDGRDDRDGLLGEDRLASLESDGQDKDAKSDKDKSDKDKSTESARDAGEHNNKADDKAKSDAKADAKEPDVTDTAKSETESLILGDGRAVKYEIDDKGNKVIAGIDDPRLKGKILDTSNPNEIKVVDPESGKVVEDFGDSERSANKLDADRLEAEKPEVEKPEVEKPEVDKPEATEPEVDKPEAEKPEAEKPEATDPEADDIAEADPPIVEDPNQPPIEPKDPNDALLPQPDGLEGIPAHEDAAPESEVTDPEADDVVEADPPIVEDPNQPPIEPKDPNDASLPQPDGLEGIPAHEDAVTEPEADKPADNPDPQDGSDEVLIVDPGIEEAILPESDPGTEAPAPAPSLASMAADNSDAESKPADDAGVQTDEPEKDESQSEAESEPEVEAEDEAEAESDEPEVGA